MDSPVMADEDERGGDTDDAIQEWKSVTLPSSSRNVYINTISSGVQLLPPKDTWNIIQDAPWKGWKIPYGWEPALSAHNQLYFLNHLSQESSKKLPVHERLSSNKDAIVIAIPESYGGNYGFVLSTETQKTVIEVVRGGPADNGADGLLPFDDIIRIGDAEVDNTTSATDIAAKISAARGHLLLTVLRDREVNTQSTECGSVLHVSLENGHTKKIRIGERDTANDIKAQILTQCGLKRQSMFQLRLPCNAMLDVSERFRWIRPDQVLSFLPEFARDETLQCWLSVRFVPGVLDQLQEADPLVFQYLYAQTVRWVQEGLISHMDEDSSVLLASQAIHQRCVHAGGKRGKIDWSLIDANGGLPLLFPVSLRDRVKRDVKTFKKKISHNARTSSCTSEEELMCRYLDLALDGKAVGVSHHTVLSGDVKQVILINHEGLHITSVTSGNLVYKNVGKIEQIVTINLLPPGSPSHTTLWSIEMKIHQSQLAPPVIWTLCGSCSVIEDIAYVVDVYYKLLVNSRGGIINRRTSVTDLQRLSAAPGYAGHHNVFAAGWNYDSKPISSDASDSTTYRTTLHQIDLPITLPTAASLSALAHVDVVMTETNVPSNHSRVLVPGDSSTTTMVTDCDLLTPPANFCSDDTASSRPMWIDTREDTSRSGGKFSFDVTAPLTPPDPSMLHAAHDVAPSVQCSPPPGFGDAPTDAIIRHTGIGGTSTTDRRVAHGAVVAQTITPGCAPDVSDISSIYTSLKSFRLEPLASKHINQMSENTSAQSSEESAVEHHSTSIDGACACDELDASFEYLIEEIETVRSLRQGLEHAKHEDNGAGDVSAKTREQLVEVWVSIKALVASLWDMTEIIFAENIGEKTSVGTSYLRQGASDACAVLGSVLEVATQLPSLCPGNTSCVIALLASFDGAAVHFLRYFKFVVDIETAPGSQAPVSMVTFLSLVRSLLTALSKTMRDLSKASRPIRL
eukprot:m.96420 g.96420  ORF g.96420 m.96420 type:complete len:967 (-) comp16655_c0_seq5:535-3435(-)